MTFPRTFLECMDEKDLSPSFLKKVRHFKIRGSSGKLNIALDGLPDFPALRNNPELIKGDMHLIDSVARLERAYDDWKNGIWSQDPYIDMLIPSLTDPTMAPPGKHFMSIFVQYVPPKVKGKDWTDEQRDAPELALEQLHLRIVNSGQRHRVGLRAVPPEALASLRGETIGLIDRIRAETEFEPRPSALCRWCEYSEICPDCEGRGVRVDFSMLE